jgi:hypothetical protein
MAKVWVIVEGREKGPLKLLAFSNRQEMFKYGTKRCRAQGEGSFFDWEECEIDAANAPEDAPHA